MLNKILNALTKYARLMIFIFLSSFAGAFLIGTCGRMTIGNFGTVIGGLLSMSVVIALLSLYLVAIINDNKDNERLCASALGCFYLIRETIQIGNPFEYFVPDMNTSVYVHEVFVLLGILLIASVLFVVIFALYGHRFKKTEVIVPTLLGVYVVVGLITFITRIIVSVQLHAHWSSIFIAFANYMCVPGLLFFSYLHIFKDSTLFNGDLTLFD